MRRASALIAVVATLTSPPVTAAESTDWLARLDIASLSGGSEAERRRAVASWKERLAELEDSGVDGDLDRLLLASHLKSSLYEAETLQPHARQPASYLILESAERLGRRPCGSPSSLVNRALEEIASLPERLDNARLNLERPPRIWVEDTIEAADYASQLLEQLSTHLCDPAPELDRATSEARAAVESFSGWLRETLLSRAGGALGWSGDELEQLARRRELLADYELDRALALLENEVTRQRGAHGDATAQDPEVALESWSSVLAQATTESAAIAGRLGASAAAGLPPADRDAEAWLDLSVPMPRLRFWAVSTVRPAPLAPPIRGAAALDAQALFTPSWVRVEVLRSWLDESTTLASRRSVADDPIRSRLVSDCLRGARLLYLEGLALEGGYLGALSEIEQTRTLATVSRRRLWEAQRGIAQIQLARGELDLDEAVDQFQEALGVTRSLAEAAVRAASASLSPPACELWGERLILDLRRELLESERSLDELHEALWSYGEIPLGLLRRQVGLARSR